MADERELAEGQMAGAQDSGIISTKQGEIAELAGHEPKLVLTSLAHRIDMAWMREAYRRTRKDGGKATRPIGIPTLGDKVLQRAVTMGLAPVYERDFLDCSYGRLRPSGSSTASSHFPSAE